VELLLQMAPLQEELAKLDAAEKAAVGVTKPQPASARKIRPGSIMDWALRALEANPGGLETMEIIATVGAIGGPAEIGKNSLTPQLSRLKKSGMIIQVHRHWMKR
jgi:hypothetical protein